MFIIEKPIKKSKVCFKGYYLGLQHTYNNVCLSQW